MARGTVDIFGAGVAGLTAAHELAERGFKVTVYEKATQDIAYPSKPASGLPSTAPPNPTPGSVVLGGLAATQYSVPLPFLDPATGKPVPNSTIQDSPQIITVEFPADKGGATFGDDPLPGTARLLEDFLEQVGEARAAGGLLVTSYNAVDYAAADHGDTRGTKVAALLSDASAGKEFGRGMVLGPIYVVRDKANAAPGGPNGTVTVQTLQVTVPGEHGFRFFPSYYRHLHDTMKRTPVLDANGVALRSVYDNLVPTPYEAMSERGVPPFVVMTQPSSGAQIVKSVASSAGLGYWPSDIPNFLGRLLRFMYTSSKRRKYEYEKISWLQFLVGSQYTGTKRDTAGQEVKDQFGNPIPVFSAPTIDYSPAFLQDVQFSGKVLAAYNAEYGDARTNGDTWIQLFMDFVQQADKINGTLNGPTSEAWFRPWRNYLESIGVTFKQGELASFGTDPGTKTAVAFIKGGNAPVTPASTRNYYIVCALDATNAEIVCKTPPSVPGFTPNPPDPKAPGLPAVQISTPSAGAPPAPLPSPFPNPTQAASPVPPDWAFGTAHGLNGFTSLTPFPVDPLTGDALANDPYGTSFGPKQRKFEIEKYGLLPWDPFQTLTGIQLYYDTSFSLNAGYVYYIEDPWALTSINSQQFWLRKPSMLKDGFVSVMSVDIGAWTPPPSDPSLPQPSQLRYPITQPLQLPSGASPPEPISQLVPTHIYKQFIQARRRAALTGPTTNSNFPTPIFFTMDQNIVFQDPTKPAVENLTPYLVPIVGQWDSRPGAEPWDPTPGVPRFNPTPQPTGSQNIWQAEHGGYQIIAGSLVFAGSYLKTFTRMTTMENANESARHAVNAILDNLQFKGGGGFPIQSLFTPSANHSGSSHPRLPLPSPTPEPGLFTETPGGDYCRIWNIEENELDAFEPFRRIDALLFDLNLECISDFLGLEELQHGLATADGGASFAHAVQRFTDPSRWAWKMNRVVDLVRAASAQPGVLDDLYRLADPGYSGTGAGEVTSLLQSAIAPWLNTASIQPSLSTVGQWWQKYFNAFQPGGKRQKGD